jgi:hypothetical protein
MTLFFIVPPRHKIKRSLELLINIINIKPLEMLTGNYCHVYGGTRDENDGL